MRFIIANRTSGPGARQAKREKLDAAEAILKQHTDIKRDNAPSSPEARRVYVVEAAETDLPRIAETFDEDVLVEPELPRHPASCTTPELENVLLAQGADVAHPGLGETLSYRLMGDGKGVVGAKVLIVFASSFGTGSGTRVELVTDNDGKVETLYDPQRYVPSAVAVEPRSCYWSAFVAAPPSGTDLTLMPWPKSGPNAWWRQLLGKYDTSDRSGERIKIGIADTGMGPHPYLDHIKRLGAIADGQDNTKPEATDDLRGHGTHVAGLIGARPVDGSGDYAGVAQGADIAAIRVFGKDGGAHQGDVAEAIDALALDFEADLVNLSLGAAEPSAIEQDAVRTALDLGTLAISSAGNSNRGPISYPAAYPEVVAVGALGVLGTAPPHTMAAASIPHDNPAAFAPVPGGVFSADFSNAGPQMICSAPGVGIISTVPARPEVPAPYAVMTGTSMAAPLATAALATVLSEDSYYLGLPRDASRASRAATVMLAMLRGLGMPQPLAGYGIATAMTTTEAPG